MPLVQLQCVDVVHIFMSMQIILLTSIKVRHTNSY
uniref:Uncharacterized protein n=1 Tax=Setaria italica TaxID=4555 RepID=K3Y4A6_SETIT